MTIADALLVSVLASCFEKVIDKKTRDNTLKNLTRYASIILRMAPCARIFGAVNFCKDGAQPNYDAPKPKKEQAAAGGDKNQNQQKQQKKQDGGNQKKKGGEQQKKPESAAASTEASSAAASAPAEEKKE